MLHDVSIGVPAGSTGTIAGDLIKLVQGGLNIYNQSKVDKAARDQVIRDLQSGALVKTDGYGVQPAGVQIPSWMPLAGLAVLGVMLVKSR